MDNSLPFEKGDKVITDKPFQDLYKEVNDRVLTIKRCYWIYGMAFVRFDEIPDEEIGNGLLASYFRKTTLNVRKSKLENLK